MQQVSYTRDDVYQQIAKSGLLSKSKFETYDLVYKHGPLTSAELHQMATQNMVDAKVRSEYHPKINELRCQGVVAAIGKRKCNVTGKIATLWKITGRIPKKEERQLLSQILEIDNKIEELLLKKGGLRLRIKKITAM